MNKVYGVKFNNIDKKYYYLSDEDYEVGSLVLINTERGLQLTKVVQILEDVKPKEEMEKIEGVTIAKPKGAFYCIAKLPVKNADDFAQWLLEEYDFNGETVMVAPAAGFYSTPGVGLDEIRMAYVLKKEDLIKSVQILKEALKVYKN